MCLGVLKILTLAYSMYIYTKLHRLISYVLILYSSIRLERCVNCTVVVGTVHTAVVVNKCENVTMVTACQSLHIRWAIQYHKTSSLLRLFSSYPVHLPIVNFICVCLTVHWFWEGTLIWCLVPTILTIINWRITWDSVDSTLLPTYGTHPQLLEVI